MFRIPRIQPLTEEIRMVIAGSRLWWMALAMNSPSQLGTTPGSNPPEDGNAPSRPANSVIMMRPSQKNGIDDRNVVTGMSPSIQDPRRQPAITPAPVPRAKLNMVVTPTRAIVQGNESASTSETG